MMNNEDKPSQPVRRPYLATECESLKEAEKWRHQVIRETSKKVSQIQNAGMGEFRIRDLNDEINKLLREKRHWEDRVMELGGPNYGKIGPKMLGQDGKELPGNRGYKYFGAAKDLPGVRELFEQEPPKAPRKNRAELYRLIDADYYGYRDDDDGVLVKVEAKMQETIRKECIADRKAKVASGEITVDAEESEKNLYLVADEKSEESSGMNGERAFISHVPVPTQKDVENILLQRKKQELMERYTSELLQSQSLQAKTLLGV